jgi:CheY-like chemotaxis protein
MINLLGNAFKYTHKGRIDFGYELVEPGMIRISVSDTGIGIPENAYDIIFKRFRQVDDSKTRKYGGNGLGLSICKGLVEAMKGSIWFSSKFGEGSDFHISLPVEFQPAPVKTEGTAIEFRDEMTDLSKYTILLAEDEESNSTLIHHILRPTSVCMIHVRNGSEAIRIFEQGNNISLGLIDIKMPEVNGLELAGWIRNHGITIPLIAQTACAMPGDKEKCLAAGFNDYIAKPVKIDVLLNMIRSWLYGKGK